MLELKKQDLSIFLEMFETSKIRQVSISEIRVSGLNDAIYKQVDPDDPSITRAATQNPPPVATSKSPTCPSIN